MLVVGPVPPPVDGRAVATAWLLDALRELGASPRVLDTHRSKGAKVRSCLRAAALVVLRPPEQLLIVASGDTGLAAEVVPAAAARLRRVPVTVLHHNAGYVRRRSRLFALLARAAGPRARHVVLSAGMGDELATAYGIARDRVVVLDNAGLMPVPAPLTDARPRRGVLHLSHLMPEKGLDVVAGVAERLGEQVTVAGEPTPEGEEVLARAPALVHVGGLYGDEKLAALWHSRVLLFPSRYRNEAQPLTLYEAAACGAVPVAFRSGWIGEQLAALGLERYGFDVGDVDGITRATAELLAMDDVEFSTLSSRTRSAFLRHREQARAAVAALLSPG
jgi:glycosyltransferase involved in cell wall biosynthesis